MTSVLEQSRALDKQDNLAEPEAGSGGFTRELPVAGAALLRLQSYIEVGLVQPRNATWKPSVDCILTFELLHPKHMITPDGKPPFPQLYSMHVPKSNKAGSRYSKLFTKMNWEKKHTHFDTMIGATPFLGKLFHKEVGEGKDKTTYVNLNNEEGEWVIGAPRVEDPLSDKVTIVPVPEMHQPGKLFLWEEPTWAANPALIKQAWDELFIETPEDAKKSRNWIQETIRKAIDWQGSSTQAAINEEEITVDNLDSSLEEALGKEAPAKDAPVEQKVANTDTASDADILASLGI